MSAAACWMPDRKLAGAAVAAASNRRLMVRPPEVIAAVEAGPLTVGTAASEKSMLSIAARMDEGETHTERFVDFLPTDLIKIAANSPYQQKFSWGQLGLHSGQLSTHCADAI